MNQWGGSKKGGGLCMSVHCWRLWSEEMCVCVWVATNERGRRRYSQPLPTQSQTARQTFDRGALWFASFIFREPPPPPVQSDNYETNALDPHCLSGNGHLKPETQREGSNLYVSTDPEGGGTGRMRNGKRRGGGGYSGVWEFPHSPVGEISWTIDHRSGANRWWC